MDNSVRCLLCVALGCALLAISVEKVTAQENVTLPDAGVTQAEADVTQPESGVPQPEEAQAESIGEAAVSDSSGSQIDATPADEEDGTVADAQGHENGTVPDAPVAANDGADMPSEGVPVSTTGTGDDIPGDSPDPVNDVPVQSSDLADDTPVDTPVAESEVPVNPFEQAPSDSETGDTMPESSAGDQWADMTTGDSVNAGSGEDTGGGNTSSVPTASDSNATANGLDLTPTSEDNVSVESSAGGNETEQTEEGMRSGNNTTDTTPVFSDVTDDNTTDITDDNTDTTLGFPNVSHDNTTDTPNVPDVTNDNTTDNPDFPDVANDNITDTTPGFPDVVNDNITDTTPGFSDVTNDNTTDSPGFPDAANDNTTDATTGFPDVVNDNITDTTPGFSDVTDDNTTGTPVFPDVPVDNTTDTTPVFPNVTDDATTNGTLTSEAEGNMTSAEDGTVDGGVWSEDSPVVNGTPGVSQSSEKADFIVHNSQGRPCLLASFNITIHFKYHVQEGLVRETYETVSKQNVQDDSSFEGLCQETLAKLSITWANYTFTLNLTFLLQNGQKAEKDGGLDMDVLPPGRNSSEPSWSLQQVSLSYDTGNQRIFPGAYSPGRETVSAESMDLFQTPLGLSYMCKTPEAVTIEFKDVDLAFNYIHLLPFGADSQYFTNETVECSGDLHSVPKQTTSYTMPLVVAACLAGFVVFVIVAYASVRCISRRVRQSDYRQME